MPFARESPLDRALSLGRSTLNRRVLPGLFPSGGAPAVTLRRGSKVWWTGVFRRLLGKLSAVVKAARQRRSGGSGRRRVSRVVQPRRGSCGESCPRRNRLPREALAITKLD